MTMIKFLSILHQRCSATNQCYLLWLWCSVFCCWCSCGSFLLIATTVYDAQNAMAWYVVYRGKEPGVYATWPICHAQVSGFANCCYKSFATKEEAVASYLEYRGCEDDAMDAKVFVKPPCSASGNQSSPMLFLVP